VDERADAVQPHCSAPTAPPKERARCARACACACVRVCAGCARGGVCFWVGGWVGKARYAYALARVRVCERGRVSGCACALCVCFRASLHVCVRTCLRMCVREVTHRPSSSALRAACAARSSAWSGSCQPACSHSSPCTARTEQLRTHSIASYSGDAPLNRATKPCRRIEASAAQPRAHRHWSCSAVHEFPCCCARWCRTVVACYVASQRPRLSMSRLNGAKPGTRSAPSWSAASTGCSRHDAAVYESAVRPTARPATV